MTGITTAAHLSSVVGGKQWHIVTGIRTATHLKSVVGVSNGI